MKKIIAMILMVATLVTCCAFGFTACNKTSTVKIGAQAGTTGESYIKGDEDWGFAGIPNSEVASYDTIALAINDMINGNIDYAVVDKSVAETLVAKNVNDVKMIDIALTTEKYAIGVDKDNAELLKQINDAIATLKANGTLTAIYAAYAGITEGSASEPAGTDFDGIDKNYTGDTGAAGTITVATAANFPPYEYKIGEKFYGIDMEIVKIIADTYNYKVVISDMDFSAVVTAVQTGKADIAVSCLTVNAVRAKSVTFSEAYEEGASQVLVVKKSDTSFDNCKTADDVIAVFESKK